jgi:hypothetical protein
MKKQAEPIIRFWPDCGGIPAKKRKLSHRAVTNLMKEVSRFFVVFVVHHYLTFHLLIHKIIQIVETKSKRSVNGG